MERNNKKERINVYVTPELKEYVEEQSKLYSMSVSSYFAMCVIDKKNVLENMDTMKKFMDELPQLQKMVIKNS